MNQKPNYWKWLLGGCRKLIKRELTPEVAWQLRVLGLIMGGLVALLIAFMVSPYPFNFIIGIVGFFFWTTYVIFVLSTEA